MFAWASSFLTRIPVSSSHCASLCLYSIYHKTHQVYTEKEILALAAKAGIASGSIPDVHQSLVDDGLVEKEKIGGCNYFWSFKSKKDYMAQKTHQATLDAIQELKRKVEEASAQLADAKRGREDDNDNDEPSQLLQGEGGGGAGRGRRAIKLQRVAELAQRKLVLEAELEALKENDPSAMADLEKELQLVTQAAHRWTDNIFECKSYLVKKRGIDKKQANKMLGITDNFDCKYIFVCGSVSGRRGSNRHGVGGLIISCFCLIGFLFME